MRKGSRTEDIAGWIRGEIEAGALPPGARIEEKPLAERFGVSKTPVREALIQLASIGLVDLRQRRGATVTVLSVEQVVSMFEVMTQMEAMAAKLAASRMPAALHAELRALHAEAVHLVETQDVQGYDSLNTRLHEIIYRGARNEYLEASVRDMRARLRIYRRYPFQRPGRMAQSHADHAEIIAAILNGDGEAAFAVMERHVTTGGQVFADLVAEMPRIAGQPAPSEERVGRPPAAAARTATAPGA
ncbi:GntR family transcriptional regulator [Xanthobacter sediminis]